MRGCTRALMMALVALIVAATAPLATAQDDRSNWDAAYDECMQRAADEYADKKAATLGDQALTYDEPLQRWLQQRIAKKKANAADPKADSPTRMNTRMGFKSWPSLAPSTSLEKSPSAVT